MLRRTRALTIVGIAAVAAMVASVLPILASDDAFTLYPVADTTVTQVTQDGDNSVKTTLASCPQLCDGNPNGRRDAVLTFAVDKLPRNATQIKATLRVHAWHDFAARIVARSVPGDLAAAAPSSRLVAAQLTAAPTVETIDKVSKGYNEFDVSDAVRQNGTYSFALQQETYNTRVYWASRENSRSHLHPELVLSFKTQTGPTVAPAPTVTTPSTPGNPAPTTTAPTTTKPTTPPTTTPTVKPTLAPTTAAPEPAPAGWRKVWADEFDAGTIDRSKWNIRHSEGRDIDLGCSTDSPKNSFTKGGYLTIRALKETATCSGQTRPYTQAYLDTMGKASWTYGRFEMRAKSPNKPATSKGLWPAFWLRPNDGGNGEIDVVELPGGTNWYAKATQAIFWDYTPVKQDVRTALPGGGYPGDGFHTYTTEWEPGVLRWYIDDTLVWQRDRSTTPWFDKAFSRPYNIRLNFQVGGWLGNPDADTEFPADFIVDYVRVWQR